jgi:hypothetical protein
MGNIISLQYVLFRLLTDITGIKAEVFHGRVLPGTVDDHAIQRGRE